MGIVRGPTSGSHHIRQAPAAMFASNPEAGKGLYIGGNDVPPTHHQHHRHHTLAAGASTTDKSPSGLSPWKNEGAEIGYTSRNPSTDGKLPTADSVGYMEKQRLPLVGATPASPSSSIPPSVPLFHSESDTQSGALPYMESHSRPSHLRHNMKSQNSAYSLIHRDSSVGSVPLSSPPPDSNQNILKLGIDYTSTVHPLPGLQNFQVTDSNPTSVDISWNLTDNLCLNRTTGSYDCWDLFNPDENDTTTHSSVTVEEEYRYWTLVLIIIPILTVFGNILVVMSVIKEKSLKTVTNYFICSLAVADIMVAVVVMSFAVYMENPP